MSNVVDIDFMNIGGCSYLLSNWVNFGGDLIIILKNLVFYGYSEKMDGL